MLKLMCREEQQQVAFPAEDGYTWKASCNYLIRMKHSSYKLCIVDLPETANHSRQPANEEPTRTIRVQR